MNLQKISKSLLTCLFLSAIAQAQNNYTIDISKSAAPIISGHLKLGSNKAPNGDVVDANSLYFIKNGKPWYPVMGEIHFSRYPRAKWEEAILKMKAAGIDVIASYVFWIYHEEEQGKFSWTGNNDLRAFVELCKKHNVAVLMRVGPWCHGEVRNGGFPDWLMQKGKANLRKNNPEYLAAVQKFYNETAKQLTGLYFKDGGPIVGAQIENEFRFNSASGLEHMLTLKKMAVEAGIDVPFYTATGWPGSNQKQDELIPVWGAYPEAPWDKRTIKLPLSENYVFSTLRNDPAIGADLLGVQEKQTDFKGYRYPYATAEMGGGNQITYHRRPIIEADDVTALSYVKVGAGANLMGYYMFHGGSNPFGKLSTLQESKATKYPNDYPIVSYDFFSPLGEWGQVRDSYKGFKTIHTFLNDFGDKLVQYYPAFPDKAVSGPSDNSTLRWSVRSKGDQGFVFISNFQRQLEMKDIDGVQFTLKSVDGPFSFPRNPIKIKKGLQAILPFNMDMEGLNLKYATVQPFCKLDGDIPTYVFFAPEEITPEYLLDKFQVREVKSTTAKVTEEPEGFYLTDVKPGTNALTEVSLLNGNRFNILTLSGEQAKNAWQATVGGVERLFISEGELTFPQGGLNVQSDGNPVIKFSVYPDLAKLSAPYQFSKTSDGIFTSYTCNLPDQKVGVSFKEVSNIAPYKNKGKLLPWDTRDTDVNTSASPGPQYQSNLTEVKGAKYYELTLPASIGNLNEAYLKIDYNGDTGAAYLNGKLVADDFYSGLPMIIGLRRFVTGKPQKMLLQIVPLTAERKIYFEDAVAGQLKNLPVGVKSVNVVAKYELKIGVVE